MGTVGIRWGMLAIITGGVVTRENVIGDELWFPQPPLGSSSSAPAPNQTNFKRIVDLLD